MGVTAMAVEVRLQPMRRTAETTIAHAAIFPQVSVRLALESVHMGGVDVPVQTASLFARQGPAADISPSTVRLEKGRRLTFRLTEPVLLAPQRTQASR